LKLLLRFPAARAPGHFSVIDLPDIRGFARGRSGPVTFHLHLALIMGLERLIRGKSPGAISVGFPRVL
jgi:hypothetical protein